MSEERMYTTQQTAAELGVSDAYVRQLIRDGKATPKTQIGGTWMFAQSEVDRLKTRSKSKGGRPPKKK